MHWNTLENENGAWEGPGRALAGMLFAVFAALDVEIEIAVFLSFVVVGFRLVPFFCQNFFSISFWLFFVVCVCCFVLFCFYLVTSALGVARWACCWFQNVSLFDFDPGSASFATARHLVGDECGRLCSTNRRGYRRDVVCLFFS